MRADLLSPGDAGRLLGVSTERVQQFDRAGKLRALRDSAGRRLFRRADVLRFKAKRESGRAVTIEKTPITP